MAVSIMKMGPGRLTIGPADAAVQFASQVRSCVLKPKVKQAEPKAVLSGEFIEGDRDESFTLEGKYVQDFGSAGSRTEWMFEHRGERHPFTFVPDNDNGKSITGEVIIEATDIGGEVGTKPESEFEFSVVGAPKIVAATDPAPAP